MNSKLAKVVLVGEFQVGKSTLINCLLGEKYAQTGNGIATTNCCMYFRYGDKLTENRVNSASSESECREITCRNDLLRQLILVDTPGFNHDTADDQSAGDAISDADIVILVHEPKELDNEIDQKILNLVKANGKRLLILMNCTDVIYWGPNDEKKNKIADSISAKLESYNIDHSLIKINNKKVWQCNPIFAMYGQEKLRNKHHQKKVDDFCKEKHWDKKDWERNLLEASGIEELKNLLANASRLPLFNVCNDPEAELCSLTERWANRFSYYKSTKDYKGL